MLKKHIVRFIFFSAIVGLIIAIYASKERLESPIPLPSLFYFKFPVYGDVILNLSSGYVISVIFYFLVVYLPERAKCRRIRAHALKIYESFRKAAIRQILFASGQPGSLDEVRRLMDPKNFDDYWSFNKEESRQRYYDFLNGLNEYHAGRIALELEILRDEIQYVISNVDVEDENAFAFMKNLSVYAYEMSKTGASYDEQKQWGRFLSSLLVPKDDNTQKIIKDPLIQSLEKI